MPRVTIANLGKEAVSQIEILDEIPRGWELKNVKSISASYFIENKEYGIPKNALKIHLSEKHVRIFLDFSTGVKIGERIICSMGCGGEVVLKYLLHPMEKIETGIHETGIKVRVIGLKKGEVTQKNVCF